ncbi:hypothetical protein FACS189411_01160 [Bacteroidia bacterium]|nr:hypothetical protein FACS189411_01160 [Bacteroidia bacterium]
MKTIHIIILSFVAMLCLASCADKYTVEQNVNSPVYMSYEDMRASLRLTSAQELVNPGKISFKDNYLFVVEQLKGIHVIDVSNPASPQNKAFIELSGCRDIALKDQFLYADHYVDLVELNISDINNVKETARLDNFFPYTVPAPKDPALPFAEVDHEKGIVVDWEVKRERKEENCSYYPGYPYDKVDEILNAPTIDSNGSGSSTGDSFGKSGSMARFGLYDHYLYIASTDNMLKVVDVNDKLAQVNEQRIQIGSVETIFIHDHHIFFGTTNGMLIYSLENPSKPYFINTFTHLTSCDPVVVQDHYAYVTLRSGTNCGGNSNQLDVIKLSDDYISSELVKTYPMMQPFGLGIDGNTLFICDGPAGLKVFDVADKEKITTNQLAAFPNIQTYDVIPVNNYLFMIGADGFYLYDYKDITAIKQLSHIPVLKQ